VKEKIEIGNWFTSDRKINQYFFSKSLRGKKKCLPLHSQTKRDSSGWGIKKYREQKVH
jgi:hypothetical protein